MFVIRIIQESSLLVLMLILAILAFDEEYGSINEYTGFILSWVFVSVILLSILCEFIEGVYCVFNVVKAWK